jgi:hypothetical protein
MRKAQICIAQNRFTIRGKIHKSGLAAGEQNSAQPAAYHDVPENK